MQITASPAFGPPTARLDEAGHNAAGRQDDAHQSSAADSSVAAPPSGGKLPNPPLPANIALALQQQPSGDVRSSSSADGTAPTSDSDSAAPYWTSDPDAVQARKHQQADQQRLIAELNKSIKNLQTQQQAPEKTAQQPGAFDGLLKSEQKQDWWKTWNANIPQRAQETANFAPAISTVTSAINEDTYTAKNNSRNKKNKNQSAGSEMFDDEEETTASKVIGKPGKNVKDKKRAKAFACSCVMRFILALKERRQKTS